MPLAGKKVAVVGGGNVAMDAARCSKRLGADVYIVYRRGMEELPARHEEVEHAEEEGIIFKTLTNPVKINGNENGYVASMTLRGDGAGRAGRLRPPPPDREGRQRLRPAGGLRHHVPRHHAEPAHQESPRPGLEVNRKGGIVVNEERPDLSRERLRRRRRRDRRGHRYPRHGRGQARRQEHRRAAEQEVKPT